jgi:dienelactone hydrolase
MLTDRASPDVDFDPERSLSKLGSLVGAAVFLLAGCADLSYEARLTQAEALAAAAGWEKIRLPAEPFVLTAYAPATVAGKTLTVYIEGDGLVWSGAARASRDPTPLDPMGYKLAVRDPSGASAYLARPCQYAAGADWAGCGQAFWMARRYAPEVVEATSRAVTALKDRFGCDRVELVGYSGGGSVAALVAARRDDVVHLITVAANLDHLLWSRQHGVAPLDGSLNAADAWPRLKAIPQVHFVGADDEVVDPSIAAAYQARFPRGSPIRIETIPGFDHHCCWDEQWPRLLARGRRSAEPGHRSTGSN